MIEAMIFDLDGTLVETEEIKALSYARAAVALRPDLDEALVQHAFADLVGLSRSEVAQALLERFDLAAAAQARMAEFGVATAWQAFVQVRLNIYDALLYDPELLRRAAYSHNLALLQSVRSAGIKVGLATMSYCPQVQRVLSILGLHDSFDFIASRDDVEHGKPDPEIYLLVARELGVTPGHCIVLEDSPTGVQAGLAAGMNVIAVTTALTKPRFRDSTLLNRCWIVDDPATLPDVVRWCIVRHEQFIVAAGNKV
ncbi:HAD family phosphatase [Candidatus Gracilibacteria bacterium]|nr:HAD family phosphatase [Candidatus Gracilibacteria bacterium]